MDEVGLGKASLNSYVCVCSSMYERKTEKNWEVIRRKEKKKTWKEWKSESNRDWLGDRRSCDYSWGIVIYNRQENMTVRTRYEKWGRVK